MKEFKILLYSPEGIFLYSSIKSMIHDKRIPISERSFHRYKKRQLIGKPEEWTIIIHGFVIERKRVIKNERSKQNTSRRIAEATN